jgi:hypothetical protein
MTLPQDNATGADSLVAPIASWTWSVGAALVGELLVVMANVVGRLFIDTPLLWADECPVSRLR